MRTKKLTFKDWKKKYYPVAASRCPKGKEIDHSILKWSGLYPKILEKFCLTERDGNIYSNDLDDFDSAIYNLPVMSINNVTCALCHRYHITDNKEVINSPCEKCPLYLFLGHRCDNAESGESQYSFFARRGDPGPMLEALRGTKRRFGRKRTKKLWRNRTDKG